MTSLAARRLLMLGVLLSGCSDSAVSTPVAEAPQTVRCAVIGGIVETGLWQGLAERYEQATGGKVEIVARGPKHEITESMQSGQVDLLTMHSCDAIMNLVADGYATDPEPWAKNDFLIVGPEADPAGIRGEQSAVKAIRKIVDSRNKVLVHASMGVQELLHDLLADARVELDPETTLVRLDDKQRQMAVLAGNEGAYTIVGRIPFLNGKMPNRNLVPMVQGDPRLRRPYVVVTANPQRFPESRAKSAQSFAAYLRSPETQSWLANFGRGQLDDRPLFIPIDAP